MDQHEGSSCGLQGGEGNAKFAVLIVDDEPDVLELMSEVLSDCGYETSAFTSPVGALQKARLRKFDAAVIDIYMPEMSGLLLHAKLKMIDPGLASRTLFVSGHFSREELRRDFETSPNFLPKPFLNEDLVEKVNSMLPPSPRGIAA
jgi:CheY-like chemotaxis protein